MLAVGRLLRLSLTPSALADGAAGMVLGAGLWPPGPAPYLLMAGSACVYHGGMALNDWADREEDARTGRGRPLARGEISAPGALALAVVLLVLGPVLAWGAAPRAGACLAGVALIASFYDLGPRGPWLGPLLLALCRAGNLGAGWLLGWRERADPAGPALGTWVVLAPLLYGGYVFCLSRLARLEDRPEPELARSSPSAWLHSAALLLFLHACPAPLAVATQGRLLGSAGLECLSRAGALLLAAWSALGLLRARPVLWKASDAGRIAGMGLRRLLIATSALAAQVGTPQALLVAVAILAGYPWSHALRRIFPPT